MRNHLFLKLNCISISIIAFVVFLFPSCVDTKHVTYFQDLKDTSKIDTQIIKESYEVKIQSDDVLGISVNSVNPQASAIFNMVNNTSQLTPAPYNSGTIPSTGSTNYSEVINGYLVNKQGFINFPVLGNLKVVGLTTSQVKDTLLTRLTKYLETPIINVRLLNYKVTVLGEVSHPAVYSISSERISVIDAIGMAGDLTIYGKRENVLLIREEDGKRTFIRLDLNSSNLFQSPYYYLKQNDIVYVEPSKAKVQTLQGNTFRTVALVTSVVSVFVLILIRISALK